MVSQPPLPGLVSDEQDQKGQYQRIQRGRVCLSCKSEKNVCRTGPDGIRTLCRRCGARYRFGALKIYQDIYGNTTVIPKPGSREIPIYGFPTISQERDFTSPAIWPFPSKDEDRVPAPVSAAALNCPTCEQPLNLETNGHAVKGEPQLEVSQPSVSRSGDVQSVPSSICRLNFPVNGSNVPRLPMRSDQNQNDVVSRQLPDQSSTLDHSRGFGPHIVTDQSLAAPRESCSRDVQVQNASVVSPKRTNQNVTTQRPAAEEVTWNDPKFIETFSDDDSVYNVAPSYDPTTVQPKPIPWNAGETNAVIDTAVLQNNSDKTLNLPPASEGGNRGTDGNGKVVVAEDLLEDDADSVYEVTDLDKPVAQGTATVGAGAGMNMVASGPISIIVKASFRGQMKKFTLRMDAPFSAIRFEIMDIFNVLESFVVTYKDDDNDTITMSSDRDATEFFKMVRLRYRKTGADSVRVVVRTLED